MTSHLAIMALFAACVATTFATLTRQSPSAQLWTGLRMFAGLVVGACLAGWLLYGVFG